MMTATMFLFGVLCGIALTVLLTIATVTRDPFGHPPEKK